MGLSRGANTSIRWMQRSGMKPRNPMSSPLLTLPPMHPIVLSLTCRRIDALPPLQLFSYVCPAFIVVVKQPCDCTSLFRPCISSARFFLHSLLWWSNLTIARPQLPLLLCCYIAFFQLCCVGDAINCLLLYRFSCARSPVVVVTPKLEHHPSVTIFFPSILLCAVRLWQSRSEGRLEDNLLVRYPECRV